MKTKISDIDWTVADNADMYGHLLADIQLGRRNRYLNMSGVESTQPRFAAAKKTETEWRLKAECLGLDPELFFPDRGGGSGPDSLVVRAQHVCRSCPVKEECLLDALATDEHDPIGIRGGKTGRERRIMMKVRRQAQKQAASAA